MKKLLLFVGLFFFLTDICSATVKELSMQEIEQKTEPSLLTRLLDCLLGRKRLEAYEQRTQEYRPSPYEW